MEKLKNIIFLMTVFALLSLTGCSSTVEQNYESGVTLLEEGKYDEASVTFQGLGSYEEAGRLLLYCRAALTAENGDFETAQRAFSALGSFRDAPEMLRYYEGREAEADGQAALSDGDYDSAVLLINKAAGVYDELPEFRDAALRKADCLNSLYEKGRDLLNEAQYSVAVSIFDGLGSLKDSAGLKAYCEACILEEKGASLEAAESFSNIPTVLDAAARADKNRETVYRQALELSDEGNEEKAIALFTALGSFRDAETRRNETVRLLIQNQLQHGDYDGALLQLDLSPKAVMLKAAGEADRQRVEVFLDNFVQAYLHFSAGSMDAYSGYFGVYPYIEEGGALDRRFRQVLMIGSYSHNSNFIYYGSELLDVFLLDDNCYLAYVRATASVIQPIGPVEVTRTFRVLMKDTENGLLAGAIEDCLYGETDRDGRLVVTGPLPDNKLPADEDGDGIILVDVMKKGFNGTMMIVLDPSRVFVGGPGFYGGNGMLLEDLVKRYDALGGINAGGFIDEDGGGSGGLPEGLTIVDGESYYWAGSGASAAFDENNILHVGYYTIESAAEAGIRDCASFGPALIVNGAAEYGTYMESGINPRTAIGQREDGAVLLLCIDGRQIHSIGASFADIRDVMLDFGAVNACSLDGGSSTVMYYDGEYVNSPSSASGTSRYLPNAFLIKK